MLYSTRHTVVQRHVASRLAPRRKAIRAAVTMVNTDYDLVTDKLKEMAALGSISGLLDWDEMVMMPKKAAESRAKQKAR